MEKRPRTTKEENIQSVLKTEQTSLSKLTAAFHRFLFFVVIFNCKIYFYCKGGNQSLKYS